MYYLATVGYEKEQLDGNGNPRLDKVKYVVQAESVEEATIVLNKYKSEDMRSSESISIVKMAIECILDPAITPQLYKG
tara:strand:- start:664 stop:897 length:234 start_codon:yes stop_codon:yes gene_type:complete